MSPGGRLGTMPYVMLDSLASNYGHLNALAFSHSYANFKYIFTTSRVPVGRLRTCSNAQVWYENTGFEVHYNAVFPYLQSTSATSAVRSHTSLNFLLSTITCTHVHAKTYASTHTHTHTHTHMFFFLPGCSVEELIHCYSGQFLVLFLNLMFPMWVFTSHRHCLAADVNYKQLGLGSMTWQSFVIFFSYLLIYSYIKWLEYMMCSSIINIKLGPALY